MPNAGTCPTAAKPNPSAAMSNAIYANEPTITPKLCERSSDRLIDAVGASRQPGVQRAARADRPQRPRRVPEATQKPWAQYDDEHAERRDQRRYERQHRRAPAGQDPDEDADPHQHERDEVRRAGDDEESDRAARDVTGGHPGLAQRPDAEREAPAPPAGSSEFAASSAIAMS